LLPTPAFSTPAILLVSHFPLPLFRCPPKIYLLRYKLNRLTAVSNSYRQVDTVKVTTSRIAAERRSFSRIRQLAPICIAVYIHGFLGAHRSLPADGTWIGSAIFRVHCRDQDRQTDRQTNRTTCDVCSNSPHLAKRLQCGRCRLIM